MFAGESIRQLETERIRKDGRRITVSLTVSPVKDANGRVVSASVIARDITERRRYEQRLRYLADHDQLTGLFNRRRFEEELKRELARAASLRRGRRDAAASISTTSRRSTTPPGTPRATRSSIEVAATIERRFRATDLVARLGGDEFGVLLTEIDPDGRPPHADDLLAALHACRPIFGGKPLQVQASIGVSTFHVRRGDAPTT